MVAIVPCQGERSAGKEVSRDICISALNMSTIKGPSNETVEKLSRRLMIFAVCKNQDGGVSQFEKLQGEILTTSFSGKEKILAVECRSIGCRRVD